MLAAPSRSDQLRPFWRENKNRISLKLLEMIKVLVRAQVRKETQGNVKALSVETR